MLANQITLGGLFLGGSILIYLAVNCWRLKSLLATLVCLLGLLTGWMGAMCTGGVLGVFSHAVAAAGNRIGDKASGGSQGIGHPPPAGLSVGGGLTLVVLVLIAVVVWACSDARLRAFLSFSTTAGCLLGLTASVVVLAGVTVIPWANTFGATLLAHSR